MAMRVILNQVWRAVEPRMDTNRRESLNALFAPPLRPLRYIALALLLAACTPEPPPEDGIDVGAALGGAAAEGFARADRPRAFRFPEDHGPHPAYRNEWWYFTGNLEGPKGGRYGFQLTLFRIALTPDAPQRPSRWAAQHLWMGHFAVTDVPGGRFHADEQFARGALGLAGAAQDPLRIWLKDWEIRLEDGAWRIRAAMEDAELALTLNPEKAPVLQGDNGLSQKSAEPGNASYYYSIPRLAAAGRLRLGGESIPVQGQAWLDREWSTSALGADQAGWDWFSLQFDDGRELMYYRLRKQDGTTDPHSAGSLIGPDGEVTRLAAEDVTLQPLEYWQSPAGGRYPIRWRMQVRQLEQPLTLRALLPQQEVDQSVRYWEGAVEISGPQGRVLGRGYAELTGYSRK